MKIRRLQITLVALPALCGFGFASTARANDSEGKAMGGGEFHMMDSNGDGKISADEHAAGAKMMFDKMDTDKDGKVTAAEMDTAHERMAKMMGKEHKAGHADMTSADKIKAMDTNHDGVLSAEEHAAGAKMMFDKMDTDKDGYLSKSEMEAGHARLMSKMSQKGQGASDSASDKASQK
jgi:Ca2+-binding EF-hand superfamily protein